MLKTPVLQNHISDLPPPSKNASCYCNCSGIGRAAAVLFARNNYKVSLTGRNVAALNEVAGQIISNGSDKNDVLVTATELTSEEAPRTIVDATINSAGILRAGPVLESGIDVYDELMNVNVRSLVRMTRAALPYIVSAKGTVVNVSSINGPCPFPNVTYYCMSKSAVDQFTKCLALEMAPNGVRVNAVCPGVTVTNLHRTSGQDETTYSAFLERSKTTHALGRPGDANEVAEAIYFLASEKSSFTTGELLRVDGGRGIMHPR
uniref:3-oxoacyl-[acyl-carrier-protein] reductase FabG n=1 Tax=Caenorhabditis tropicalis TaxID=1561998 RepID=A0A1I7TKF3_9PELO